MPGQILTTSSTIQCPHQGVATLLTSNATTSAGSMMLLESDIHIVAGCTFLAGTPGYSPCITIEWSAGADAVSVNGTSVLVTTSIGTCKSGEGAPQGVALIGKTQAKASAR